MEHLCATLQTEFGDSVSCTISQWSDSIHIIPRLDHDFFTQVDIMMITQYCLLHGLHFYFQCDPGRIVVYYPKDSELISKHK